jgi:hypothetical protein
MSTVFGTHTKKVRDLLVGWFWTARFVGLFLNSFLKLTACEVRLWE